MTDGPFTRATAAWLDMLKRAQAVKDKRFTPEAAEGVRFFSGPYDFYFNQIRNDKFFRMPNPDVEIVVTYNKVAEFQQIFAPAMYQRNPTRRVTTRPVPEIDPNVFVVDEQTLMQTQQIMMMAMQEQMMDKALAQLNEALLNVTPDKTNLKDHSRQMVDESLIKGAGVLWTDYKTSPASGNRICGNYWGSIDDFLMDPDATSPMNFRWCARRTFMTRHEIERKWHVPQGFINSGLQFNVNGLVTNQPTAYDGTVMPDMVEVWEVWSKMGMGRLEHLRNAPQPFKEAYELLGDFVYMVLVPGHPWPLNLPPWMFRDNNDEAWLDAKRAVNWPTPFWVDGGWPCTLTYYHTIPRDPWPMSHLTPAMGELKFLNWAFAKIASKIGVTSRDLIFCSDQIAEEVEQVIKFGADLSVVKVQGMEGKSIKEFVEMFQHDQWNPDIWKVMQAISDAFDQRVGLNELMYGQSARQMRSAAEADRKYDQVNVRPDDMAQKVEESMSAAARNEMWCGRWHYRTEDVQSLLGIVGAFAWENLVLGQDMRRVLDLQARVESDSSKKPNKAALATAIEQAMINLVPMYFQAAQAGMMEPFNALVTDWCKANGIPDPQRYMLQLPPMPPIQEDPNRTADRESEERIAEEQAKAAKKKAA